MVRQAPPETAAAAAVAPLPARARSPVRPASRAMSILRWWAGPALAFALLALLRAFVPLPLVIEVVIFSIYAAGCNFLLGHVGLLSFGQPAYLAVGAYGTAWYLYYGGTDAYVGILIGIAAGIAVALLVGPLFVRLRKDYFALVNLALTVIIYYLMEQVLAAFTHGDDGMLFMDKMSSTPVLDLTDPGQFFIFSLLVGFALWVFYKYLDSSIFGACCLAAKINEDKLCFIGYSDFTVRLAAFVIANTTTALAGSMFAVYLGFVSPELGGPSRAADPVVITILGGAGTLYGPIVGSIAYIGMKDLVSKVFGNWELIIGGLLVFVMLAGEQGIWGSLAPMFERLWRRVGASAAVPGREGGSR